MLIESEGSSLVPYACAYWLIELETFGQKSCGNATRWSLTEDVQTCGHRVSEGPSMSCGKFKR